MVNARHLLPAIATAALLIQAADVPEPVPTGIVICNEAQVRANACYFDPETGEFVLRASQTEDGAGGVPEGDEGASTDDTTSSKPKPKPKPARPILDYCKPMDSQNGPCGRMDPAEPGTPSVSITDVARYKPAAPTGISQPDGWGLLDRPVNFVISAEPHIVTGQLLNQPADVRFTPVGFQMETSDGAVVESVTPGDTWEDLGQDDFTETPTSHVFTERGTHTITPTVIYIAEYRFAGSGWVTVPSVLPITGEPRDILIGTIETVLIPNPGE